MHPQFVTIPFFSRFVFTSISRPQSHLHRQTQYRSCVLSVFSSTVRCPNLAPVRSLLLAIFLSVTIAQPLFSLKRAAQKKPSLSRPRKILCVSIRLCFYHSGNFPVLFSPSAYHNRTHCNDYRYCSHHCEQDRYDLNCVAGFNSGNDFFIIAGRYFFLRLCIVLTNSGAPSLSS